MTRALGEAAVSCGVTCSRTELNDIEDSGERREASLYDCAWTSEVGQITYVGPTPKDVSESRVLEMARWSFCACEAIIGRGLAHAGGGCHGPR